jgi:glycosyltransferase involved in cell wall biosynthesis
MHGLVLLIERGVASTLAPGMVAAVGLARTMVPLISTIPSAAATGGFAAALAGGSGSGSAAGGPGRAMVYAALLPAVPILVVLLARTEAVIGVLFEHGRFTGADTGVVSAMALLFAGSAPYLVLATPLSRALQAARLDRAYLGACLAGFAAYGPLAVGWGPDRGALGLILAYGVAMNLHLLVMAGILSRRTGSGFLRQPWGRLALAGLGAAGAVAAAGQIPAGSYLGELALAGLAGAAGFGLTGWLLALPGLRHRWRAPAPATGSGPAPRPPVKVLNCLHRSHFGGTHWRVIWIAEALRRHGVETTVLFPANPETEYQRMLEARGIPFRRLPLRPLRGVRRVLNNLLHLLELPLQVLRVARLVRREGFDLVYVNSLTNLAPLLGARLAGRPVVWHWNDMLTPRAYARLVRPLLTRPSGRLVVAARAVALHYRLDREAEPPPVLSPPLPPAPAGGVAELPFEAAPGEAVVGFVSNLVAPKGCHEFLETIAQLRRQGLAVRGVMVGGRFSGHEGYARRLEADRLRLGLAEAVSMVGYRTDVERWMRRFDVLLFPSHTEAAPITVIQALGVGLPLVATRVGFVEEMLAGTGLPVVAVGDVPAMVAGLRALLALGPEERAALAERMRAVVAGQFAIEAVAGRHLALYASLLPGRLPGVEPA